MTGCGNRLAVTNRLGLSIALAVMMSAQAVAVDMPVKALAVDPHLRLVVGG